MTVLHVRRRQATLLAARMPNVASWQPAAAAAAAGWAAALSTPAVGGDPMLRMRLSVVAMAAALAFVLDDRAAVTLASSPLTLLERRFLRIGIGTPVVITWWVVLLVLVSVRRSAPLPSTSMVLLELGMYSVIGLAGSVWSQRRSADGSGGIAGAVLVTVVFLSALVRMPAWWPLATSSAGVVPARLQLVLGAAVIVLVAGSLDPCRRRPGRSPRQAGAA